MPPDLHTVLVSDAHLTRADEPAQAALVALVDALPPTHLVLLGDIFHFWWGWAGVVDAELVPLLAALLRARARGVRLSFVPGNHDWRPGPFFVETLGARVLPELREPVAGRRLLAVHGDEVDTRLGYRITRAALRGRAFGALMRALGPERGQRLGMTLAGGSRRLGADEAGAAQGRWLLARQREWALARLGPEADLVVMGHCHQPTLERHPGGVFVNLGDWARDRLYLCLEPEPQLRRW